nr:hypothetical protein [Tanacetum cinerariifolium]
PGFLRLIGFGQLLHRVAHAERSLRLRRQLHQHQPVLAEHGHFVERRVGAEQALQVHIDAAAVDGHDFVIDGEGGGGRRVRPDLPQGEVEQQRRERALVVDRHLAVGHAGLVAVEPEVHAGIGQTQVLAARVVVVLAQHNIQLLKVLGRRAHVAAGQ